MKERLIESFQNLVNSIIAYAPKVAVGIVLLILGLVVAKIIEVVLRAILVRIRFDSLMEKAGIDRTLHRIGIRQQLNIFIPRLVYFLVIFLLAKTAADALNLTAISGAIGAFFSYLPNIIAALLLLILGSSVGQFAGQTVTQAAEDAGIDFAPTLGRITAGLIIFIVGVMAISQLKIDTEMVRIVTALLLAGAALAFGISFGLGTRDIVRNIAAGFYARKFVKVGKAIEISGAQGTVVAILPTHTMLESNGQSISLSNARLLDDISKQ